MITNAPLAQASHQAWPLIQVLRSHGGQATTQELYDGILAHYNYTPAQLAPTTKAGQPLWHNRVRFARLRLVFAGWVTRCPDGSWALTSHAVTTLACPLLDDSYFALIVTEAVKAAHHATTRRTYVPLVERFGSMDAARAAAKAHLTLG